VDQKKIGAHCHENGIKFINANTKGLFGYNKDDVHAMISISFSILDKSSVILESIFESMIQMVKRL
jgi:hypothetical protein